MTLNNGILIVEINYGTIDEEDPVPQPIEDFDDVYSCSFLPHGKVAHWSMMTGFTAALLLTIASSCGLIDTHLYVGALVFSLLMVWLFWFLLFFLETYTPSWFHDRNWPRIFLWGFVGVALVNIAVSGLLSIKFGPFVLVTMLAVPLFTSLVIAVRAVIGIMAVSFIYCFMLC